jgi:hypothetical protein
LRYQTQANNRAVMLIGGGRETNPTSEVFACVEWIEGVVGKLVCTDCHGLWNVAKHTIAHLPSSQMPTV